MTSTRSCWRSNILLTDALAHVTSATIQYLQTFAHFKIILKLKHEVWVLIIHVLYSNVVSRELCIPKRRGGPQLAMYLRGIPAITPDSMSTSSCPRRILKKPDNLPTSHFHSNKGVWTNIPPSPQSVFQVLATSQ